MRTKSSWSVAMRSLRSSRVYTAVRPVDEHEQRQGDRAEVLHEALLGDARVATRRAPRPSWMAKTKTRNGARAKAGMLISPNEPVVISLSAAELAL